MNDVAHIDLPSRPAAAPLLSVCVALGPGEALQPVLATIESVLRRENGAVEVVVKSAGERLDGATRAHAASAGAGRMLPAAISEKLVYYAQGADSSENLASLRTMVLLALMSAVAIAACRGRPGTMLVQLDSSNPAGLAPRDLAHPFGAPRPAYV